MMNVDASVKDQLIETLGKKIVNVIKNGAICELMTAQFKNVLLVNYELLFS